MPTPGCVRGCAAGATRPPRPRPRLWQIQRVKLLLFASRLCFISSPRRAVGWDGAGLRSGPSLRGPSSCEQRASAEVGGGKGKKQPEMSAKAEDGFPLRAPRGHGVQPQPRGTAGIFGRIGAAGAGGAEGAPQGRHCAVRADGAEFGAVPFGDREERVRPSRGGRAGVGRERPQSPAGVFVAQQGGVFPFRSQKGWQHPRGPRAPQTPRVPLIQRAVRGRKEPKGLRQRLARLQRTFWKGKAPWIRLDFPAMSRGGWGDGGRAGRSCWRGPTRRGRGFVPRSLLCALGHNPAGAVGFAPTPPAL